MENAIIKPAKRSMRTAALAAVVLFLLGGGYVAWSCYDVPALSRYTPVLAMLASNQLEPDSQGVLDLSTQFPGLTPRNHAYFTRRSDGSFVVMFPTYYGEGVEVEGLLYTSRPLQDQDLHYRVSVIHFNQQVIAAGTYTDLLLEKRINPSWYHVSCKMQ
jgi:hypothetical protein